MHYHAEVWVPSLEEYESCVEKAMARYDETLELEYIHDEEGGYWYNPDGLWDWYQIGGRWTGVKDGYSPEEDPDNRERCFLCKGIGKVDGKECHVCNGEGDRVAWPTGWVRHDGDVCHVSDIPDDLKCYTLILPNAAMLKTKFVRNKNAEFGWEMVSGELGDMTVKEVLKKEGIEDGYLVTVDYHS